MGNAYRAFISYSHRDAIFAGWLHSRLEAYRFPGRLIGRDTARGPVSRTLTPIFRDREELSAAPDLTAEVLQALAASQALIVVCSPNAAASTWVNREIEAFRQLHPDGPIFSALYSGEPADAFPPALRQEPTESSTAEPLAADFRQGQDGRRLGLLKLLAGLAGLPLGDLIQRDAQRRLRRVTAVTVMAAFLVLMLAALTVTALRAQSEAERRRAEAEGLVEFMLTDLRDELRGVGRLDVMTAVNERALAYYTKEQNLSRLPDESLERRARVLLAMGEDDENQGESGKAVEKFLEAHRTTAATLTRHPDDPDTIFTHAQSAYWVGYAEFLRNNLGEALRHWQSYMDLALRLSAHEPGTRRALGELSYASGNLCSLALQKRSPIAGRVGHYCAQSVERKRQLLRAFPDMVSAETDLVNGLGWLADYERNRGDYAAEEKLRREQLSRVETVLARDSRNLEVRDTLITVQTALAGVEWRKGHRSTSRDLLAKARQNALALIRTDPSNKRSAKRLVSVEEQMRQ